jgi:Uma2 family endonuclease
MAAMNVSHRTSSTFTNAEFAQLVRSGGFGSARVELRRGWIVRINAQHLAHAKAKTLLAKALEAGLQAAALPWAVYQEVSVAFGDDFTPVPDIVVWDPKDANIDPDGPLPASAVKLVVEVADTTLADDLGEKAADYASGGLAEYWVLDVKGRQILQHSGPANGAYTQRVAVPFGAKIVSRAIPSLNVDTVELVGV